MKRGDIVAVCYDGKWGRRTMGEVIGTRKGSHILVSFKEYAGDSILQHWFRRRPRRRRYGGKPFYYAGFVPVDRSLMRAMFVSPGDWYVIYEWQEAGE